MGCRFPEHHGSGGSPLGLLLAVVVAAFVVTPILAAALAALAWVPWPIAIVGSAAVVGLSAVVVAGTVHVKRAERAWRRSTRATGRLAASLSRVPAAPAAPAPRPRQALGAGRLDAPAALTGRVVPRGEVRR